MKPGDVIDERFAIEGLSATGGMGGIYRALDRVTGKRVAIKVLLGRGEAERLVREAEVIRDLAHERIVRHVAHGTLPPTPDAPGRPSVYFAMEWLDGHDLATRLEEGPLTIPDAISVASSVAEALSVAHARGIFHRDIKPTNIFLRGGSVHDVAVIDFGIARVSGRPATATGIVMGTPAYMAPEQARADKNLDARADVFALGCVLFECLAGQPPFVAEHLVAALAKILFEEAPALRDVRRDVPPALADLVARMLAKLPDLRPRDGAAVVAELSSLAPPPSGEVAAVTAHGPPSNISLAEQWFLSVVLASTKAQALDATLSQGEMDGRLVSLRQMAKTYDGRAEVLADGSMLVVAHGSGPATDTAARAAGCALKLRELYPEHSVALTTGRGTVDARMPVGEAVDRAARLVRVGSPGRVHVDEVTATLLEGRAVIDRDESGHTLRAVRADSAKTRTLLGRPTPCVGRKRELDKLVRLFEEAMTDRSPRLALVTAPAGMGKSRLRHELVRAIAKEASVDVWVAQGDVMRAGAPFDLLAQIVRSVCGIVQGDPAVEQRARLTDRLRRHVDRAEVPSVTSYLAEMIGAGDAADPFIASLRGDARLVGEHLREAFITWLSSEAAAHPLIVVLDDLQWGDLPTVKCFDVAARVAADVPLFVLALARPEVHDTFPRLWTDRGLDEIRLGGLSQRAAEDLVHETLGRDVDAGVVSRVVTLADGNAFYLEELIRAVAEGSGDGLPETVLAMVQSRLSALSPPARRALRAASTFGDAFWTGAVAHLVGEDSTQVGGLLEDLAERELVTRARVGRVLGESQWTFRHAHVRDAAYASLVESDRATAHRLAGEWLERSGETAAIVLADHFELGGALDRAREAFLVASEQALRANDQRAALARAERALSLAATDDDETKRRAHVLRGRALAGMGRPLDARDAYGAALEAGSAGTEERADLLVARAAQCFWGFDLPGLLENTAVALTFVEQTNRTDLVADATLLRAMHATATGDVDSAMANYQRAVEVGRDLYLRNEPQSLNLFYWRGDYDRAVERGRQILEKAAAIHDAAALTQLHGQLGIALAARGSFRDAETAFDEALSFGARYETGTQYARSMSFAAGFRLDVRDYAGNVELAERACELARTTGFLPADVSVSMDLAFNHLERGEVGAAEELATSVVERIAKAQAWHGWLWQMRHRLLSAEIALARAAWDEALEGADVVLRDSVRFRRPKYSILARAVRARALAARHATPEADADAREALSRARAFKSPTLLHRILCTVLPIREDSALVAEVHAVAEAIVNALPVALQVRSRAAYEAAALRASAEGKQG